jgi:hypothetical protein
VSSLVNDEDVRNWFSVTGRNADIKWLRSLLATNISIRKKINHYQYFVLINNDIIFWGYISIFLILLGPILYL